MNFADQAQDSGFAQESAPLTFAHLALAAAAILALPAALIFRRFFTGLASGLASDSPASTFAHLAFNAALFFAFPAALNRYFLFPLTGSDTGTDG